MEDRKILIVRKMSALEYYYNGNHKNPSIEDRAKNHDRTIEKIKRILKQRGKNFDVVTRKELSEKIVSNYDAIISAGGDGTVIATAFYNKNTPQLNLKTDFRSDGALCHENISKAIELFLNGQYKIEHWTRQDVYLDGKFVARALNETCVGEGLKFYKLGKYDLRFNETETGLRVNESQGASGLIIVTGTGSTGWPAALKPFPRNSLHFEFKTILQHFGKIDSGKADEILVDYKGHEGKFAIDTVEYDFPRDSQLEIKLSKHPLPVIITEIK